MGMSHVDTMRALDLLGIVKSKIQVKPQPEQLEHVPHLTKWDTRKLRTYYTGVVDILYVGVQCASCGMRFRAVQNQQYAEHLDWHFRQNRKDKDLLKRATSRKWYYDLEDWIQYEEIEDLEARRSHFFEQQMEEAAAQRHAYRSQTTEPISCITASPSGNNHCEICREEFEQFWDEDEEEWKLKNAIRVDGKAYHPGCYDDGRRSSALDEASADDQGPSTVDAGSIKQEGGAPEKAALQSPPELPKFTPLSTASVEIPGISIMEEGEGEGEESAGVAVKPEPMDAETAEVLTAVKQEPEASMQQEDMHSRVAEKLEAVCSSGDVQHHVVQHDVVQHDVVQHGVAAHRAGAVAHEPAVVVKPETEPTTTAVQGSALVVKPEPGTAVVQESAVVVKSETEHAVVVQELAVLVNAEAEPATIMVQPSVLVSKAEPAEIVSQEFLVAVKPEVKIDDKFAHNSSAPVVEPQHELAAPPAPPAVVKEEPNSDQEEEGDVDMEEPGRPGGSLSPAAAVNAVEEPATNKDGVSVELSPGTPVRDEQPPSSATPIRDEPMDVLVDLVIPVAEATEELPGEAVPRT
ncbi:PREDICTED: uncharacterized protein LOC106810179 [Priapulus caudatus]|uniref:Uncharacterized protein LOC106810179 n=1 Tax=Priapulus caudatus TaxID=37621 RepID=A0ABM1E9S5_PRICU|nr:PREDICTED: uncharacterized protein LOC106810179 [Priapulus caudatus]